MKKVCKVGFFFHLLLEARSGSRSRCTVHTVLYCTVPEFDICA